MSESPVDADPKCPECGATGIENFKSTRSKQTSQSREPWFFVIHCSKCGHVYSVISKHMFTQTSTRVVLSDSKR